MNFTFIIPAGLTYKFNIGTNSFTGKNIVSVFRAMHRTNNNIEAYHKHIMRHMGGGTSGGARPNTWIWMGKIFYLLI